VAAPPVAVTEPSAPFNAVTKIDTTSPGDGRVAIRVTRLHCSRCGALVATVYDLRFGLLPASSLCLACSLPAAYRSSAA
jgi:hypothetical protein